MGCTTFLRRSGGHGIRGLLLNKGVGERERLFSHRHGIQIGPSPKRPNDHFSYSVLSQIDKVLRGLPEAHVRNNSMLRAIHPLEPGVRRPSGFHPEHQAIYMTRPCDMSSWNCTEINFGNEWRKRLTGQERLCCYEGIRRGEDKRLNLAGRSREIVGGASDVPAHENMEKWMLRHEIGHSVERLVDWKSKFMHEEYLGGWRIYRDHDPDASYLTVRNLADEILSNFGLKFFQPVANWRGTSLINSLAYALESAAKMNDKRPMLRLQGDFLQFEVEIDKISDFVNHARRQRWTFQDGAEGLTLGNRTYRVTHYGQWVSYLRAEREEYALSNYQFSGPDEWFAEAYAAYYDDEPQSRARLNPKARRWFAKTLPALFDKA